MLPSQTIAIAAVIVRFSCVWCVCSRAWYAGSGCCRRAGVRRRRRRTGVRMVPLEFACSYSCSRCSSHFHAKIGLGLGQVIPTQPNLCCENFKKKKLSSTITASPPPPLRLWRPPWHLHMKSATPMLFGGVFPKTCDAIPPWRRHNRNLTTLIHIQGKIQKINF